MTEYLPQKPIRAIIPPEPETIHTQRLVLRPMQETDAPQIFAVRSRQDVADWSWPRVPDKTVQDTEEWMNKKTFTTPDASGGVGRRLQFVIIQAGDPTERIIGTLGVNSLAPAPSIGYGIHPEFWGMGYVTEAVGGLIRTWWKLPRMKSAVQEGEEREKLFACCNKANIGSVRVLQKNGFSIYEEIALEGDIVAFWSLGMPS